MAEFREMEAEEIQACGAHSRGTPWCSQSRGKGQQQSGGTETSQLWAACSRSSHRDTSFPWAVTLVWQAPWGAPLASREGTLVLAMGSTLREVVGG